MSIKTIVIDDEHLARQYLKDYITQISVLEFVGDFNSPLKAIDLIQSGNVDLILLDIQMPDLNGLDFIRSLDDKPYIVITTAYKEFAVEGFELNVCDYLLKPFSFNRFNEAINKVITLQAKESFTLPSETSQFSAIHEDYMIVRADRKYFKINYEDILFVEGQGAYVTFHTIQKRITALFSMKDLEEKLPSDRFLRIHKSYIISIKHIDSFDGNWISIKESLIPIGKLYRGTIDKIFGVE